MKKGRFLTQVVTALSLTILFIGVYESITQKYSPGGSILSYLHSYGYLTGYPVVYQPSKGIWHPLGWTGSGMMVLMMLYSVRKRVALLASFGSLRRWLSVHMFLGIMGPLLVTFHTTLKLGGIVATSFWCMIVTMVFGIMGRYIYIQIPRNLAGTELEVSDIERVVEGIDKELGERSGGLDFSSMFREITSVDEKTKDLHIFQALFFMIRTDIANRLKAISLKRALKSQYHLSWIMRREIGSLLKKKAALIRKKNFLSTSHRLLHYWHVLHVPLAVVMFIIMFLHIVVYFIFGLS